MCLSKHTVVSVCVLLCVRDVMCTREREREREREIERECLLYAKGSERESV